MHRPKLHSRVCILSGGQKPIGDGPIATFHFKIRNNAKAGTTTIRIEGGESTTADSKKWVLNDTEVIVVIR